MLILLITNFENYDLHIKIKLINKFLLSYFLEHVNKISFKLDKSDCKEKRKEQNLY